VEKIGKAGRDRKVARAQILACKYLDMKKLYFWLSNLTPEEKCARINDLKDVYFLYSSIFAGC
jgi:hypothetical protein